MTIPFSNSTDWSCWMSSNCDKCKKFYIEDEHSNSTCEIENAIAYAACGEDMDDAMCIRMGGVLNPESGCWNFFSKQCTEFEQLQRWYIVATGEEGKKGLLLGPYETEDLANSNLKRVGRVLFLLGVRDVKVDISHLTLTVEQLPTAMQGQLTEIMKRFDVK